MKEKTLVQCTVKRRLRTAWSTAHVHAENERQKDEREGQGGGLELNEDLSRENDP